MNARRLLLAVAIAFAVLAPGGDAGYAQAPRPNIVVIVADDLGYADIGIHGSKDIPTPNIDALARGGVRFTDAYVTGPHCSPTRAALLTGRYQQRFGHEVNFGGGPAFRDAGLPIDQTTIADRLKAAGYRTALFGKWHLGSTERLHPMARGFDEFFGFLGGDHSYVESMLNGNNPLLDGRRPVEATGYLTDVLTDRAVDFIKREKGRPFFLYLSYNAVHTPMEAPEKYLSRFSTSLTGSDAPTQPCSREWMMESGARSTRCDRKNSKRTRSCSSSATTAGPRCRRRRSTERAMHRCEARSVRRGREASGSRSSSGGKAISRRGKSIRVRSFNSTYCRRRSQPPASQPRPNGSSMA